ncbi:hypothetical protein EYF80_028127 [Liparis tanakae]|uniref:Uncharacterized protein n=1 Tax=Liparis tanakae TaxID=230148 RepID=A0A4Z2HA15_9TELE|nr:hypothetical protein EYF80_028127 [Liparis tanakae]
MSSPPSDGVMKPWPFEREKHLHTPVEAGPSDARAVLQGETGYGYSLVHGVTGAENNQPLPGDTGEHGDPAEVNGGVTGRNPSMGVA